jgi:thiamine-phosphate pyrophosphorylase
MILPRFYPILDSGLLQRRGIGIIPAAREILDAGARILQFRHKGQLSRETWEHMEKVARLCQNAKALYVINDRADLARLLGAALHIGQDDLPPAAARRVMGPDLALGFSTHNEAQLRLAAAEPVDYVALGPIFGTGSKENPDPVVGVEELRRLRPLTTRQLVAIGGITRANALSVLEAGADSVAVIGDLYPEDGQIQKRVEEWLRLI